MVQAPAQNAWIGSGFNKKAETGSGLGCTESGLAKQMFLNFPLRRMLLNQILPYPTAPAQYLLVGQSLQCILGADVIL